LYIGIHVNTLPTTVFINRLLEALVKRGHKVVVFGTAIDSFKKIKGVSYAHYVLHSFFNSSKVVQFLKYSILLSFFKRKQKTALDKFLIAKGIYNIHQKTQFYPMLWHQPDILHVQWVKGIEQFLWVKKFDIKLATSLRGSHIYLTPLIDKEVANSYCKSLPQLDGIHSVCQDLINTAIDYSLLTDRSTVIYSGLEIADFPFIKPSKKQSINEGCLNIISVGRASWMKKFDVALDAMQILNTHGVKFKYTIVGVKNSEELTFQIHDLNLQNQVELFEWQPFERVKKHIQSADVLLISSVSEGIANAAIEAMALGTIVLSTDCGGMKELVEDGINGMITPMRNPREIAKSINLFNELTIQDKDSLAKNARKKVEAEFDMSKNIGAFEHFYENCLQEW